MIQAVELGEHTQKQMDRMKEITKELNLLSFLPNPLEHTTALVEHNLKQFDEGKCNAEIAEYVQKQFDEGNRQFTCGIDHENIEIPASPSMHFVDRDALVRDLGKIAWLPRSGSTQKFAPGCSIGLTLVIDHLLHLFYNIKGGQVTHHLKVQMKIKDLNGKWEHCTIQDMVNAHFSNMLSLLGVSAYIARCGSRWHCGLGMIQSSLTPTVFQETINHSMEGLSIHVRLMDIDKFDKGHEYLESINLFSNISQAHTRLLLQPIKENPDLSVHFNRLHHRAQVMINLLTHFDALRTKQMSVYSDVRYADDLKTGFKMMLEFFNEAEKILGKSGVAKGDLSALGECYRFVRKWSGAAQDPNGNFRIYIRLSVPAQKSDIPPAQRTKEEQEILFVSNQLSAIEWMHTSLLDETLLCVLNQLMANQKVETNEILKCLSRLQEVIETIENAISEASRLIEAPFALLANDASALSESLRSVWKNDFLFICNHFIKPSKRMLEVRSTRIKEAANPALESASTLREILSVFGGQFRKALTITAGDLNQVKVSLTDQQTDDPAHIIWKTMHDLIQLQEGAFEAAVGCVEALVGEGLEALREKEIEVQREAAAQKQSTKKSSKSQKQEIDDLMKEFGLDNKKGNKKTIAKKKGQSVSVKTSKPSKKPQPSVQSTNIAVVLPPPAAESLILAEPLIEIVPIEIPQIVRKLPKPAILIIKMKENLEKLEFLLPIAGCDQKFRKHWRAAQITNTLLLMQEMKELIFKDNVRLISGYDQVDLARRLVEAILEVILATYPVTGNKNLSCLHDTGENGHRLHAWIRVLMNAIEEVPAHVRETIWSLREVPFMLSDANSCVNYPHSTSAAKTNRHPLSRALLDWLLQLEKLNAISPEEEINLSDFSTMRKQTVLKSLYFSERVLTVMLNPQEAEKSDLPDSKSLKSLAQTEIQMAKMMPLRQGIEKVEEDEVKNADLKEGEFSIRTRNDALTSISMALKWIKIRLTAPVQGILERSTRTEQRDLALRNTANYLLRLTEHLSGDRFKRPQSTLLGQLRLIRRILKETAIAALFHHREGGSIAHQERYTNNPVALVKQVRAVQGKINQLPQLGRGLSVIHTSVSYPAALNTDHKPGFEERELRKIILEVKNLSSQMENLDDKKQLRTGSKELLETNEKERLFPGLKFLLEMLISDFPKAREL